MSALVYAAPTHLECSPSPEAPSTTDGFLSVHENRHPQGFSTLLSSSKAQSNVISFSWSDFPILGRGAEADASLPPDLVMEDTWSSSSSEVASDTSSDTSSTTPPLEVDETETVTAVDSESSSKNSRRKVRFSSVLRIRTLPVTLGDHPCCVGGMALTTDWSDDEEEEDEECIDLDVYERFAHRRVAAELRLSYQERRDRLVAATGWSPSELLQREYALVCQPATVPDERQTMVSSWHALRPSTSFQGSLHALDGL